MKKERGYVHRAQKKGWEEQMLISELGKIILEEYGCELRQTGEDRQITHFSFLSSQVRPTQENCLYIGEIEKREELEHPIAVLTQTDLRELPAGSWILYIAEKNMMDCLNEITKIFFEEQKREEEFERLMPAPGAEVPFCDIINQAALFFDRSLVLTDLSFKVIAYSTSRPVTDAIWKENIAKQSCSYEFIQAVDELLPEDTLPKTTEAFFVNCEASSENKLCSYVFYHKHLIGYLLLLDNEKGILPYHMQYMPRISKRITMALKYPPNLHGMFLNVTESILLGVLESQSLEEAKKKLRKANLKMPSVMRCLIFVSANHNRHDQFYLERKIRAVFPRASCFIYRKHVIAIVEEADYKLFLQQEVLPKSLRNVQDIGASASFQNIYELPEQLECAFWSCEIARKLGKKEKCHCYEAYHFYDILSQCKDKRKLETYVHPALEKLHLYDLEHSTELLETLETYVEHGLKVKETAVALYLHRNTLTYRLNKIKELTGMDFENVKEVFQLANSFPIYHLLSI